MKLILAQGNPGHDYHDTRHNVGFRMLDTYAHAKNTEWAEKSKFHSYLAEFSNRGEKVLLAKPTTFYNETGQAARALVDFYKLDPVTDVLVLHDDIALPLGTIRTREKGSSAGNNGIKSLNAHLDEHYSRVRIGIHTELTERMDPAAFVLGKFTADERTLLQDKQPIVTTIIDSFVDGAFELTSHK